MTADPYGPWVASAPYRELLDAAVDAPDDLLPRQMYADAVTDAGAPVEVVTATRMLADPLFWDPVVLGRHEYTAHRFPNRSCALYRNGVCVKRVPGIRSLFAEVRKVIARVDRGRSLAAVPKQLRRFVIPTR